MRQWNLACGNAFVQQFIDGVCNVDLVTSPTERTQTEQTRQVVVHHGFHVLEPLQLGGCFVVMEPASEQHQTCHDQPADRGAVKLIRVGDASAAPHLEKTRCDLNSVETAADVCVEDFLTDDGPNNLSTRLNAEWIAKPSFIV